MKEVVIKRLQVHDRISLISSCTCFFILTFLERIRYLKQFELLILITIKVKRHIV